MLIRVMYRNRKYDMVKDYFLENLIAAGRIARFCRSGSWVEIDRGPLRGSNTRTYTGPERRDAITHRPLNTLIRIGKRHYQPNFSGHFDPD